MGVPHPIPYQGSKRHLARTIISYFPDHAGRLIEPFAGSAAVTLAAAYYRRAEHFLLNDLNVPLMALWEGIINRPERIASLYEWLWLAQKGRERRFYDLVRERFNRTRQPYYLLYLLARCVKASVRYNTDGEFNQSPDNRRRGRHPQAMRRDILGASLLLRGRTRLMSGDYRAVLKQATPADIIYMDPPYQGVCSARDPRYLQGVSFDELVEALRTLNDANIPFMISYDGRSGDRAYGQPLPAFLGLRHIEIDAGRSSQATLLGRSARTYESLYLSPALMDRLGWTDRVMPDREPVQMSLL